MTQDEIIEMARQAGFVTNEIKSYVISPYTSEDQDLYQELDAFAKLIAEKAIKEALAQPEQEPVAWLQIGLAPLHEGDVIARTTKPTKWNPEWWRFEPLYTTPPQRKPLTGWQPIETAPRDGTEILMTNGVDVSSGQWFSAYGGTCDQTGTPNGDDRDAEWMDWSGGMQPDPTHWMPLPPPPIEAAHGIKE